MLEKTSLNSTIILKILKNEYGIKSDNVTQLNRGSANIFNIDDKYILKEFTTDRTVSTIEKEYGVIKHLSEKGMLVPDYVLTKNNSFYTTYNERIIIVQKFINGHTMENNTGNEINTLDSAKILGELVLSLQDYKISKNQYEFPTKKELEVGISKSIELIKSIKEDNPYKDKIKKDLLKKVEISKSLLNTDFDKLKDVSIMLCHGDYSVQQLIYTESKIAIIDFETIKYMPIVWEIIRSYTYIDENCKDGKINIQLYKKYIKEVSRYITLTKNDIKYMPLIYLLQLVSSTFGYKQYIKDYNKNSLLEFALFRTNLCVYIHDHLEELSNLDI